MNKTAAATPPPRTWPALPHCHSMPPAPPHHCLCHQTAACATVWTHRHVPTLVLCLRPLHPSRLPMLPPPHRGTNTSRLHFPIRHQTNATTADFSCSSSTPSSVPHLNPLPTMVPILLYLTSCSLVLLVSESSSHSPLLR
jgi:hypothetical protein